MTGDSAAQRSTVPAQHATSQGAGALGAGVLGAAVLDDERLTVMGLLAETWASVSGRTGAHLAGNGLTPTEFEVCLRLARSPSSRLRMSDLAAQTSLTSSGITRVVDRLVERGLVQRRDCASDRRSTYAVISDSGLDLLTEVLPGHIEILDQWLLQPLRTADLDSFLAGLRSVRDHSAPCATAGIGGPAATSDR